MAEANDNSNNHEWVDLDGVNAATKPEQGLTIRHHQICEQAAKKQAATAKKTGKSAETEYNNKLKCVLYEEKMNCEQMKNIPLHSSGKNTFSSTSSKQLSWSIGSYVKVCPDTSPGNKSYGGEGYIIACNKVGRDTFVTVKYQAFCAAKVEHDIPLNRITPSTLPIYDSQLKVGNRKSPRQANSQSSTVCIQQPQKRKYDSLIDKLCDAGKRNLKAGWRKTSLGFTGDGKGNKAFMSALSADYREVNTYIQTI